jgi:hypothetical protein
MGTYIAIAYIIAGLGSICVGTYFLLIERAISAAKAPVSKDIQEKFKDL